MVGTFFQSLSVLLVGDQEPEQMVPQCITGGGHCCFSAIDTKSCIHFLVPQFITSVGLGRCQGIKVALHSQIVEYHSHAFQSLRYYQCGTRNVSRLSLSVSLVWDAVGNSYQVACTLYSTLAYHQCRTRLSLGYQCPCPLNSVNTAQSFLEYH